MVQSNITFIVYNQRKFPDSYTGVLKKIINSSLPKSKYEIIFLGYRTSGFSHVVVCKEPLVRAFYDSILNDAQRLNAAILESHCPVICLWPGLCFIKNEFKPVPDDVKDAEYYLAIWLRINKQNIVSWSLLGSFKTEFDGFGRIKYQPNWNDTIRLSYKFGGLSLKLKLWYLGLLLRSIGR